LFDVPPQRALEIERHIAACEEGCKARLMTLHRRERSLYRLIDGWTVHSHRLALLGARLAEAAAPTAAAPADVRSAIRSWLREVAASLEAVTLVIVDSAGRATQLLTDDQALLLGRPFEKAFVPVPRYTTLGEGEEAPLEAALGDESLSMAQTDVNEISFLAEGSDADRRLARVSIQRLDPDRGTLFPVQPAQPEEDIPDDLEYGTRRYPTSPGVYVVEVRK
jgi:hypothetical protein